MPVVGFHQRQGDEVSLSLYRVLAVAARKCKRKESNLRPAGSLLRLLCQLSYACKRSGKDLNLRLPRRVPPRPPLLASPVCIRWTRLTVSDASLRRSPLAAEVPKLVGRQGMTPQNLPVDHAPRRGRFHRNVRSCFRLWTGTNPIAMRAPFQGASGSRMATCGTQPDLSCRSSSSSLDSSSTARTTAFVLGGTVSGADSPAAWTIWAARMPNGRSLRTTM